MSRSVLSIVGGGIAKVWSWIDAFRRFLLNFIFLILLIIALVAMFSGGSKPTLQDKTQLVLSLDGRIVEQKNPKLLFEIFRRGKARFGDGIEFRYFGKDVGEPGGLGLLGAAIVADPRTPPATRAKLELVSAARAFAADSLGLPARDAAAQGR